MRKTIKILIVILILLSVSLISVFFYDYFTAKNQNEEMDNISEEFIKLVENNELTEENLPRLNIERLNLNILGIITIDKIGIRYPIIEYIDDSYLNYSICKLSGPNINEQGNVSLIRT